MICRRRMAPFGTPRRLQSVRPSVRKYVRLLWQLADRESIIPQITQWSLENLYNLIIFVKNKKKIVVLDSLILLNRVDEGGNGKY